MKHLRIVLIVAIACGALTARVFTAITYRIAGDVVATGNVNATAYAGSGSGIVPSGSIPQHFLVPFPALTSCPAGYTEYTAMRGRYAVGVPLSGTLNGTAGTALTNTENRATGTHTHTAVSAVIEPIIGGGVGHVHSASSGITPNPHDHTVGYGGSHPSGPCCAGNFLSGHAQNANTTATSLSATTTLTGTTTGINTAGTATTVNNFGVVTGTNAPYKQALICEKS